MMASPTFGKYVVTEVLGSGGMAEVYASVHPDLGRKVAIKVILPQYATESDFEERFRREARMVGSLRHAHIVQIYDFDVVDGRHFMVMEYLDGGTLKEHLRVLHQQKSRMSLLEVSKLIDAMAGALDYAHGRGAIHRDIKPANILFTAEREPVLADFGIAKLLEDSAHLTATGGVVGSPIYMPPEQASGSAVDARGDLYSLGVVLYEMVTGRVPFRGNSAVAVMTQHLNSEPRSPRAVNAALSVAADTVLLKALAKRPEDRFSSAGELALAFRQAVEGHSGIAIPGLPTDEHAHTVSSRADAAVNDPVESAVTDAATVVSTGAESSLPAEHAETVMVEQGETASPPPKQPVSAPAPRVEPPQADPSPARIGDPPPDLPDHQRHSESDSASGSLPEVRPGERDPDDGGQLPPAPSTDHPKPTTQNFNVGGIQAGVVNQGGEQTFTGDLTFNLDFGEIKAAPPQQQIPGTDAALESVTAPELAAILETLRRAFAGSARVDRFVRLVTQFQTQLDSLPAERANDRKQVFKRVQALLMEMTEAKPDPDMVEIMGASLERAVQPLSGIDPDLPTMVTRITSWVDIMVQPE